MIKELDDSTVQIPSANERDLLAILREPGIPPHKLSLKVGCIATIMRNISMEDGLVKNSRVRVIGLLNNLVQVQLLQTRCFSSDSSNPSSTIFNLPQITFEFRPRRANWTVQRRQFPLRLAYATTFNSCQGLTL